MMHRLSRGRTVRKYFARRPLRRRIVALAAAYAIALSSLIASFGAASAAAEAATAPDGIIICHTIVAGSETPSPADQTNSKHCIDNCCVGCLMLMAAVPAPPAKITGAPLSASQSIGPPQNFVLVGGPDTKDHRSRAPPLAA
jgi:hypothetical protein